MSDTYTTQEDTYNDDYIEVWDAIHYSRDTKGRVNWLKIGKMWAKPDSEDFNLKLFAYPLPNGNGEVYLTLRAFDPDWKKGSP